MHYNNNTNKQLKIQLIILRIKIILREYMIFKTFRLINQVKLISCKRIFSNILDTYIFLNTIFYIILSHIFFITFSLAFLYKNKF